MYSQLLASLLATSYLRVLAGGLSSGAAVEVPVWQEANLVLTRREGAGLGAGVAWKEQSVGLELRMNKMDKRTMVCVKLDKSQ